MLFCYLLLTLLPIHYYMFVSMQRERKRNEELLKELSMPKKNRVLNFPKPRAW